jgi:hypothetical protein
MIVLGTTLAVVSAAAEIFTVRILILAGWTTNSSYRYRSLSKNIATCEMMRSVTVSLLNPSLVS